MDSICGTSQRVKDDFCVSQAEQSRLSDASIFFITIDNNCSCCRLQENMKTTSRYSPPVIYCGTERISGCVVP